MNLLVFIKKNIVNQTIKSLKNCSEFMGIIQEFKAYKNIYGGSNIKGDVDDLPSTASFNSSSFEDLDKSSNNIDLNEQFNYQGLDKTQTSIRRGDSIEASYLSSGELYEDSIDINTAK